MAILTLASIESSLSMLSPLLGWILRATVLLACAGIAAVILARCSAALRHLVWTAAFGSVLVLPALCAVLPAWRAPAVALPRVWTDLAMNTGSVRATDPNSGEAGAAKLATTPADFAAKSHADCDEKAILSKGASPHDKAAIDGGAPPAGGWSSPRGGIPSAAFPAIGLAIWALGSLLALTWFVAGHVAVRRIARSTVPASGTGWEQVAAQASRSIGFHGRCNLRVSDLTLMPMTWGLLTPRVMLPVCAESWPVECRRLVIMHELAHVQRRDCLTQALAQLVCALLWFHPLAWYGARRMRIERERACDDRVLEADTLASTYAGHLLAVVRALRVPPLSAAGAVSFAHPSQIEGRLLAVLRAGIDRRSVDRGVASRVVALALLLALPLAALEPATAGSIAKQRALAAAEVQVVRVPATLGTLDDRVRWAHDEAGASGQTSYWIGYSIDTADRFRDGLLGDTHPIDLATLGGEARGARIADVLAFDGTAPDVLPGPVAILLRVAGKHHEIDRVRFQSYGINADLGADALYWLDRALDMESVAMLRRLRAETNDSEIEARLLESTALHASSKLVVPELRRALEAKSDGMRAQAAQGLAGHPQTESVQLLVNAARHDPARAVRERATEALGVIEAAEAFDALVELARSGDEAVRAIAVEGVANALAKDATPVPEPQSVAIATEAADAPLPSESPTPIAPLAPRAVQSRPMAVPVPNGTPTAPVAPRVSAVPRPVRAPAYPTDDQVELERREVEAMGNLPEDESLPQLLGIIDEHPSRAVRLQAVQSIARVGGSAAMSLLHKFAWQHPDEAVRLEAVQTLGHHLPGVKALSQLSEIAEMHPDDVTRQQAVETLGQLETPGAARVLKSIVESDPSDAVQRRAVEAIGDRADPGVLDFLAETARTHPNRRVRNAAVEAIGRLDSEEAATLLDALVRKKEKKDKF